MFVRHLRQFRHIAADEAAIWIKTLGLCDRIENPKPGLCIAARRSGPLPTTVVGRQVKVIEVLCKVCFSHAPVHPQVFGEKAGYHHAQAVVHVTRLVQLAHGRVHQWVTCFCLAPCLPKLRGIIPLHTVIGLPK